MELEVAHPRMNQTILGVLWTPLDTTNVYRWCDWYDGYLHARGSTTSGNASRKSSKADQRLTQYLPYGYLCADLLVEDGWARDVHGTLFKVDPVWGLEWAANENTSGVRTSDGLNPILEFRVRLPDSYRFSGAIPSFGKRAYFSVFRQQVSIPDNIRDTLLQLGYTPERLGYKREEDHRKGAGV